MSRFHDEFFKPKGTKHDKLMIKCVSSKRLKEIASEPTSPCLPNSDLYVLKYKDWDQKDALALSWCVSNQETIDEVVKRGTPLYDIDVLRGETIDYQTEVICRNGMFIIGYADLVITYAKSLIAECEFEGIKYTPIDKTSILKTIVEIKPEMEDVGAVIRQLKTYQDILSYSEKDKEVKFSMVIATPVEVDQDVKEYLHHEGVRVYKIEDA